MFNHFKKMSTQKLQFVEMYQVKGVLPLYHDLEAGQVCLSRLDKIGLYGDKNYLFYYKDGLGKAFYEKEEMKKAAEAGFRFFSQEENLKKYLQGCEAVIQKINTFIQKIKDLQYESLSKQEIIDLVKEKNELDEEVFTYFCASQPQVVSLIEEKIKDYLKPKLNNSEAVETLSILALSEKPTVLTKEESAWLQLIKQGKELGISDKNVDKIGEEFPEFYQKLKGHFEQYIALMVGDGQWHPKVEDLIKRFKDDITLSDKDVDQKMKRIATLVKKIKDDKARVKRELSINEDITFLCNALAEIGHIRIKLRTDGFLPLNYYGYSSEAELNKRLNLKDRTIPWTTKEELELIFSGNEGVLKDIEMNRKGSEEYLFWIDDGVIKVLYGEEARTKFNELVKTEDLSAKINVKGNVAMPGKVQGKVCLFHWGDNLEDRLEFIKENKVLVAGQTRPQLMPLIRQASAIVTDEGGVISHAAIVSRELGIPCITGTKEATGVFNDGDMVEVDADSGIVKLLTE